MEDGGLQAKLLLSSAISREEEEINNKNRERLSERLVVENKKLWVVAIPSIFTGFSTFGLGVISQAFIGHIGPTELAAYALVVSVLARFANGLLLGMASALETLCGQSYGAKQYHMLGIYLQRSWIILFISTLIMLPLFIFTTPLLLLLGQDEAVALMAGKIALWFLPIMFSYMWTFTVQMYLQAQSKNMIITYLAVVSLTIHPSLCWILTTKFRFGLGGVMSSMIVSMWLPVLGQLGFVLFGGCPETWTGLSFGAFVDLWAIMKLSLSSGVMICLNINGWEMMISFGFMRAAGVRVGNELGAGSARLAKFSIMNVMIISSFIGIVFFIFFLFFRGRVAYVFTDSMEVVGAVADLSPLLSFSLLLNSIQPVLSGVAVGSGWQGSVAYVNITCYYVVGIPLGIVLGTVVGLQVKGIWIGMLVGTTVQTLVLAYMTLKTDWNKQVVITKERVNKWYMDQPTSSDSSQQPV